ncbi:phosphate/phosphite/phosphonate ABC transporter substrate-binding protein [Telmatospirillum sp. J64-1]|uniref:phosphate/phosphite/phosphonate ABC transporter substrate-binding protein n=1 Tax=Telmatospirillum sp. J64-1 TaxID=2502183 RepID=UPI00115EB799|nr:phosphate/phosphite/phosphonate ABC transporter substrate-binding protein [Telmatospirillum sp. J64-1]
MFFKKIASAAAAVALSLTASFTAHAADPIRFAVTDIAGMEELQREFGPFRDTLAKLVGRDVDFFAVNSRTAAVEAMNAKSVDFVLTGPAEYVVFRARTNAEPVVGWSRPGYFSQIVVMADSPYITAQDLKGKRVAFGDVGSTSQHLGPARVLADLGLVLGKDYSPMNISRNVAVEGMIRGDIAAIGMNRTHLDRVEQAFPNHQFRVIARGGDLPSDVLIAGAHVPQDLQQAVRKIFLDHGDEIRASLLQGEDNQKFKGGFFHTRITDADFNDVRTSYRVIGVNQFSEFVGD